MKLGDKFTMNVPVRRKWWQVWKPKHCTRHQGFGVVCTSDGLIEELIREEKAQINESVRKWYVAKLTQQIQTARRNKKKSSHLVAELKKLGEQK